MWIGWVGCDDEGQDQAVMLRFVISSGAISLQVCIK